MVTSAFASIGPKAQWGSGRAKTRKGPEQSARVRVCTVGG